MDKKTIVFDFDGRAEIHNLLKVSSYFVHTPTI